MILNDRSDLIALLQAKNSGFSEVFHKIAGFILNDYQRACFMTAQEIAMAVGVSQPSVTRFTTYLGFSGFPQFQRSLQRIVREEMTGLDRMKAYVENTDVEVPYGELVRRELENISQLADTFSKPAFRATAAAMARAQHVVVAGFRASSTLALHTGFFLSKVHPDVRVFTSGDTTTMEALLPLSPEKTTVLIYAFPRYAREIALFQRLATMRGFPIDIVTDNPLGPLVDGGRHVLIAPIGFESLFDSYSAPFLLANALVQETAKQNPGRTQRRLEKFEAFAKANEVFLSGSEDPDRTPLFERP